MQHAASYTATVQPSSHNQQPPHTNAMSSIPSILSQFPSSQQPPHSSVCMEAQGGKDM